MSDHGTDILTKKSVRTVVFFLALAVAAGWVPAPWWEGPLLSVTPELPEPSGAFVRAPEEKNQEVKQELAKVDLSASGSAAPESAPTPEGDRTSTEPPPEEPAPPAVDTQPLRQTITQYDLEALPSMADIDLHAKIGRLADQLDKPPVQLERPCLEYYPAHVGDWYRPVCRRRALDHFYAQLRRVALQQADRPARLTQLGDSLIAGDGFTGELRRLLADQFGDGGFGYIHVGKASPHIHARHLTVDTSEGWSVYDVIHDPKADAPFGLAGVAFEPTGQPTLGVYPHKQGPGRSFDRVGILLHRNGRRADLRMAVDGNDRRLDLSGPANTNAIEWFDVEPGVHKLRIAGFQDPAYYYGIVLENDGPGTVVDNLGLSNGRAPRLRFAEPAQWQDQIRQRRPDLLAFAYGVNSAGEHKASDRWLGRYRDDYADVLRRGRRADPAIDCLVLSLLTRAGREDDAIEVYSSVEPLVRHQREAARKAQCAFWNAYQAMGGADGADQWFHNRPQLLGSDLAHPTGAGYKKLANLFYASLIEGFERYLDERIRRSTIPELRETDARGESIVRLGWSDPTDATSR